MYNSIVVHYGEIGIKGKNRSFFEKKLVENIRWNLKDLNVLSVKRMLGRLIVEIDENSKLNQITEKMQNIFGVQNFSLAIKTNLDIEHIKKTSLTLVSDKIKTFRLRTVRSNKSFSLSSSDINNIVGELIVKNKKLKVDLDNPDQTIFIEITDKEAFIYNEKIKSLGGLPVGVSGKVVSLISGGIDSPVSSYLAMKRGCSIIFVHFFNSTINTKQSLEKVLSLVQTLSKYQFKTKLYLVPFENIQKEIIKHVNSKFRMIIYKRFMLKISNKILEEEGALAIIDGANLAQVSSQTLSNINVINQASNYSILSPVIGFDKEEIIQLAKKIKTYEISILPYQDCCSFLISEHPATRSNINEIKEFESNINEKEIIDQAIKESQIKKIMN